LIALFTEPYITRKVQEKRKVSSPFTHHQETSKKAARRLSINSRFKKCKNREEREVKNIVRREESTQAVQSLNKVIRKEKTAKGGIVPEYHQKKEAADSSSSQHQSDLPTVVCVFLTI
jgi:CRISPR/Cas system-associated endonuclease Cas3-HD